MISGADQDKHEEGGEIDADPQGSEKDLGKLGCGTTKPSLNPEQRRSTTID